MSSPVPHGAPERAARQRLPRLAQDAVDRARLSVVPRTRVDAARVPFVGLVSLVLLTGVVGLLLFNTSLQQASFATTALEGQAKALSAREQSLRMQLADLRDPQRVARQAQGLGMVIPAVPTFLDLGSGEVLGEKVPATDLDRFSIEPTPVRNPYAPAVLPTTGGSEGQAPTGASSSGATPTGGRTGDQAQQPPTPPQSQGSPTMPSEQQR